MSHQDLIGATIAQLVTIIIIIIIRREQLILHTSEKGKNIHHINFVTKTYSPPLNMYYSLTLNYDSKSEG